MITNSTSESIQYNRFMEEYEYYMTDPDDGELCLDQFYKYGPLTDQYWSFTTRILVCNIEPYDQREDLIEVNIDLFKNHWMNRISGYKAQTPRNTAKFIAGLLMALKNPKVENIDFRKFDDNELIQSLEKIAYLNFRVNSGKNISAHKNDRVAEQIKVTGPYIIKQIKILNPQIIIIAGQNNCNIFNSLNPDCKLQFRETKKWDNKIVCSIEHFSRVDYKNLNKKIAEIILLFLKEQSTSIEK